MSSFLTSSGGSSFSLPFPPPSVPSLFVSLAPLEHPAFPQGPTLLRSPPWGPRPPSWPAGSGLTQNSRLKPSSRYLMHRRPPRKRPILRPRQRAPDSPGPRRAPGAAGAGGRGGAGWKGRDLWAWLAGGDPGRERPVGLGWGVLGWRSGSRAPTPASRRWHHLSPRRRARAPVAIRASVREQRPPVKRGPFSQRRVPRHL